MNSKLRKVEPVAIANPKLASGVRGYTGYSGIGNDKKTGMFPEGVVAMGKIAMPRLGDERPWKYGLGC